MTNLKEFADEFIEKVGDDNSFFCSEFDLELSKWDSDETKQEKLAMLAQLALAGVTVEHVANYGGEGQGEDFWSVYKFKSADEEVFVKFDGSYQSYNGSEFDQRFFVKAVPYQAVRYDRIVD